MSYKVLYRKYRPSSFKEIIGESTIVDNLKQSIKDKSFSHAYIFTGPRGTGKTSTAKVLAKTINCTNSENGEPCNECESCKNFNTSPDIIEIDAASNNGVDEIRELRTNITLAPTASNYKIYIIDEVHMLTTGAFNALLKTLEEPPSHAIFILATTEVYKVPITILSRCQRYDFKKLSHADLTDHLKDICKKEKITYENDALDEIYELSEGCARDALSILDQLSKIKDKLTLENVLTEYNIISNKTIETLLDYTVNNNYQELIDILNDFENTGMNAQKLIKKIITYLETVALNIKLKKEKKYSFELVSKLIRELNACYIDARINKNIFSIIKLCFLELMDNNNDLSKKENLKKENTTNKKDEKISKTSTTESRSLTIKEIRINNCFVEASKKSLTDLTNFWNNLDQNQIKSFVVTDYKPVAASSKNAIFTCEETSLTNLFNIRHIEIEKLLKKNKLDIKIVAITNEEWLQQKNKYKINIKNNKKYTYIEEPKNIDEGETIKGEIEDIFTEKTIEIS